MSPVSVSALICLVLPLTIVYIISAVDQRHLKAWKTMKVVNCFFAAILVGLVSIAIVNQVNSQDVFWPVYGILVLVILASAIDIVVFSKTDDHQVWQRHIRIWWIGLCVIWISGFVRNLFFS